MKTKLAEGSSLRKFDTIVIDGRNQVYKYQHTMAYLKNHKGIETGIYHGFLSLVLRLRQDNMQSRIIVAWEGRNLVRKQQMSAYKNNRHMRENSFEAKIKNLKDLLGMLGVEQKYAPGYEADDIAYIVTKENSIHKVLFVSEDRDWYQAMNQNVYVMHKNKIYSYDDVTKIEGFLPEKFGLYVLLKGKKGNNVEGIPYFPTKLAREIINNSKSVDDMVKYSFDHKDENPKWLELLYKSEEDLKEKFDIVRLRGNIKMEDIKCHATNHTLLKKLLTDLEMFKVISMIKTVKRLRKCEK